MVLWRFEARSFSFDVFFLFFPFFPFAVLPAYRLCNLLTRDRLARLEREAHVKVHAVTFNPLAVTQQPLLVRRSFALTATEPAVSRGVSRFNIYVALRYAALSVVAATTQERTLDPPSDVLPLCSDGRTSLIKRRSRARSVTASAFF